MNAGRLRGKGNVAGIPGREMTFFGIKEVAHS